MMAGIPRFIKKSVPNLFTMFNLLSGCIAILFSFYDIALAGMMIFLAGVFDFADGLAARIFDAYSDFGKELDSLADMVSFGVAPSFILFHLLQNSLIIGNPFFALDQLTVSELLILFSSFLPAIFASLRLARFNLKSSGDSFIGLPSPAAGLFFASAGYISITSGIIWVQQALISTTFLMIMNICLSALMVIPVPMFNIKFKNFSLADNKVRFIFAIPSILLVIILGLQSIPAIILYYIVLSLLLFITSKSAPGRKINNY